MKKLLKIILLGATFLGGTGSFVLAQESIVINGTEATRVIIAPPQTDLARLIKTSLAADYNSAHSGSTAYLSAEKLYYFYGARGFSPLWLTTNSDGKTALSPAAQKIIAIFRQSYLEGLRPADYINDKINLDPALLSPDQLAAFETAFSAAAVRYAKDAFSGRIKPSSVSRSITQKPPELDGDKFLLQLAASNEPDRLLLSLSPTNREFVALKAALARALESNEADPIIIANGKILKTGMSDKRVAVLRQRLDLPAGEQGDVYDTDLVEAVKAFQLNMGLIVDGIVGPATIAALNGAVAPSKQDIIANMERWRWMPRDMGDFYVFVNIPEFRLAVVKNNVSTFETRVVVGKRQFQTPIFSDEIENIVVNPYWNVPSSIARREIGPAILNDPGYLAANNMELLSGGQVINASLVDWSTTSISKFRIRQRPGRNNALGTIKFLFPNEHAVYLHDTPSKYLFSRSQRAYSHGCVRVQDPMAFAQALLANEKDLSRASLENQFGAKERWNNLRTHVPVHLAYFTLRADKDGNIRSYGDVYGIDAKLKQMLDA
ncbi:hypothetical protein MNBD_ALPHA12-928 [hydrothermal vent metagenome]|uniref:L,D-TPase catalytic domain-containing protein n=1 Tax=hydrothermal vent metagenome TaxID=652676 RepID=A0A3B0TLK6_9ZZZZ